MIKTEPSQTVVLMKEIVQLNAAATHDNMIIQFHRELVDTYTAARDSKLQHIAAKEAELKRLLESLEP